jgi:hypothetical protein
MSLFNRNLHFIKRVVYNFNVNREKFRKNKQNYQIINKRKNHSFTGGPGPQGSGPNLLFMVILGSVAYLVSKKR